MFISFGMIVFGAVLIVAGWDNVSVAAAARGDNSQPKPAKGTYGGQTSTPTNIAPSAPTPSAGGAVAVPGGHI